MKVAVLTLTRDRLEYTQHCFERLREFAGCEYDHYVLDQGSTDGSARWLLREQQLGKRFKVLAPRSENLGINRGLNHLLDLALPLKYDAVVKFDNDCELTQPDTVRLCCELALEGNAILSPRILGLKLPPPAVGSFTIKDETILDIPQIGGIFMAIPAHLFAEFRYDEGKALHDDVDLCWWFRRAKDGRCGYVQRLEANHYETTAGQEQRYPAYFERKYAEMQ